MKDKFVSETIINMRTRIDDMESVLIAILQNTINRDFNGDLVYKTSVLNNIKRVLGEEKYNYYVEYYS